MEPGKITTPRGEFNVREGGNKNGFPIVMIHGWPESSYCWEKVAENLDPSLRIIAPDLRGLGDSERTLDVNAYQKVELAKDIQSILDHLGINDFFLAGHDWGGVVAQELAFLVPERVKQLIIMNILLINNPAGTAEAIKVIYGQGAVPFWYQYFQLMPGLAEAMIKGNEKVWVSFFFGASKDVDPKAIEEYVRCYSIENTPATAASLYRIRPKDNKHWNSLAGKKFPMPALYIHGKKDTVIIPEFLNHIEDCFDSIKVESVDAAHFLQEEKPEEVAKLMNDFLKP